MKDLIFTFEDLGSDKATKKVTAAFSKAGESVVSSTPSAKVMRTAGVTYRTLDLTFADGQTLTLMVKQTGDIYQVKLNGSVVPVKNQDDQKKAVAELVKLMESNRPKFQAKLAKTKAELPAGTRSAAPKLEETLKARIVELDTQIAERRDTVQKLRDELGESVLDGVSDAIDKLYDKDNYYYLVPENDDRDWYTRAGQKVRVPYLAYSGVGSDEKMPRPQININGRILKAGKVMSNPKVGMEFVIMPIWRKQSQKKGSDGVSVLLELGGFNVENLKDRGEPEKYFSEMRDAFGYVAKRINEALSAANGTKAMDSADESLHELVETPEEESVENANEDGEDDFQEDENQGSLFDECDPEGKDMDEGKDNKAMDKCSDKPAMDGADECAGCGMPSSDCECEPISKEPYKRTWAMLDSASDYAIYHKSFSGACAEARAVAEKKGYEVDEDDWFSEVANGPKRKPQPGDTNRYSVALLKDGKPQKKALQIQIYGRDNGYELNCYIS